MRTPTLSTLLPVATLAAVTAAASSPVVDGHSHQGIAASDGAIETKGLADLVPRGFEVVVHALPVDRSPTDDVIGRLAAETAWLRSEARVDRGFYLVDDPGTLVDSSAEESVGLLYGVEWFHPLFDGDAARAKQLRELGIRLCGPGDDDPDGLFRTGGAGNELSPLGREVVAALNDAGVLIDLTHSAAEIDGILGGNVLRALATAAD